MQVNPLTLAHLFEKNIRYLVPLYQRPYVWTRDDQWEPLWEDVVGLADKIAAGNAPSRMHFLGASVQEKVDVPPGHVETRRLIDGQQRFTTLQILLVAFRDAVRSRAIERFDNALDQLVTNTHALRQFDEEDYKVWPTNVDRLDFQNVMQCGSPQKLKEALEATELETIGRCIPDAYLYFFDAVHAWLGKEPGPPKHRAQALYGALRDNVRIVVIDLDQNDDAQVIFETLNARGTPLLAADLVKNSLLNEISAQQGNVEKAYNQYWRHFDEKGDYWRRLIGRGHSRRARIEHFLQHTLAVLLREEVSATHLYTTYQDYAKRENAGTASERLKRIQDFANIYKKIDEKVGPPRFTVFLDRLQAMDLISTTPLLMTLASRLASKPVELEKIVVDVESFLVRRLVCRLSTRGYNQLFVDLTKTAAGSDDDQIAPALRAHLTKGTAEFDRWPNDEEFRRAWSNNPMYEVLTRGRLRMILEALERSLRTDRAETKTVVKGLTIEHILPQSWELYWPLPAGASVSDRVAKLHVIGNLTLVNDKLNPSLSNAAWNDLLDDGGRLITQGKRKTLYQHSTLHLNKDVANCERWSEREVAERSDRLFALAAKEWPHPSYGGR